MRRGNLKRRDSSYTTYEEDLAKEEVKRKQQRKRRLNREYGISPEHYHTLYEKQEGLCAICGCFRHVLNIDHCHTEGHVRGLLCTQCNLGLGNFKDNKYALQKAIEYLDNIQKTLDKSK